MKHIEGRVVVRVDTDKKNWHRMASGEVLRLERGYENFNRRETEPANAIVISGDGIAEGAEILIHHNALHDVNRIFNYKSDNPSIQFYSLPETECFAWREKEGDNYRPMKNFQFALRVFEPYKGLIEGIPPNKLKDVLYVTTGELKGMVCHVLKAADYEIVFQGDGGTEERIIRLRHSDDEEIEREEIVALDHNLTERLNNGELLIGLTVNDAKTITTYA